MRYQNQDIDSDSDIIYISEQSTPVGQAGPCTKYGGTTSQIIGLKGSGADTDILVPDTPLYLQKYCLCVPMRGRSVLAAQGDSNSQVGSFEFVSEYIFQCMYPFGLARYKAAVSARKSRPSFSLGISTISSREAFPSQTKEKSLQQFLGLPLGQGRDFKTL